MNEINILALETDENMRLDVFLTTKIENMTRNNAVRLIEDKQVFVNSKNVKKNYKICLNDEILAKISLEEVDIVPEDLPLNIMYEDDDIIVINKEKGMVVHPSNGHYSGTLVNALMFHCKDSLSGINGKLRPGIVHRIDMNTSGLLVVAKNDFAHNSLAEQIKEHSAGRIYEAIVYGNIKTDEGKVDKPIGRHKTDRKKMAVTDKNSKEAITHYRVIARYNGFTHMEFKLETGRTHQIRVHMQSIGHPVVSDDVYCSIKDNFKINGQCLHAKKLVLMHPTLKKEMIFECELPSYFIETLEKIKKR